MNSINKFLILSTFLLFCGSVFGQNKAATDNAKLGIDDFWRIKNESGMQGADEFRRKCYKDAAAAKDLVRIQYCVAFHYTGYQYEQFYSKKMHMPLNEGFAAKDISLMITESLEGSNFKGVPETFIQETLDAVLKAMKQTSGENVIEINAASEEKLNNFVGIGQLRAAIIIRERAVLPFSGCLDFVQRVRGVGPLFLAKMSEKGLRANGEDCR